jgi:opacity protein-like surface antigen
MKKNILWFFLGLVFGAYANTDYAEVAKTKEPSRAKCKKQQEQIICCEDEIHFYAKAFGGANFLQSTKIDGNSATYKTGYIVAGSMGTCWRCQLRGELEYAYRRNGIEKIRFFGGDVSNRGHFRASSVMVNLFWDLPLCSWGCSFWKLQPYLGAGTGYDFQKMHASNSRIIFNQNWNHFSWQLMAGIFYPIFRNAELSLEYKFHQGGSQFNNHSIGVALAYKFGFIER